MPHPTILDAHIHLWPSTATSPLNHAWMTNAAHPLAKQHGINEYKAITQPPPRGFIYVETDRYLPSPTPDIVTATATATATPDSEDEDDKQKQKQSLRTWAAEPLAELRFLRRIVEGTHEDGVSDERGSKASGAMMRGCVVWAPFHLPHALFKLYLDIAEAVAGPVLWSRVVGFRYLLQGKAGGVVKGLLASRAWLDNIVWLGAGRAGKGWAFDVGVDVHRDGVEVLGLVAKMIREVRELEQRNGRRKAVRFVLNHLCKPPLSLPPSPPSPFYTSALATLTPDPFTYIKLSGAFNEFTPSMDTPADVASLLAALQPYLDFIRAAFPHRVMFGSDWPVCNVGGPAGEKGNWALWRELVAEWVAGLEEEERERVWWGAGCEAYGIEMLSGD